ncbi:MAG: DUF4013 domain-containing protein [Anaerolineaceae bacterium]|nr:DUF4013 domain-containing protein [Anaerolineaceae bacterium]
MKFGQAFGYIFKDPDWFKKLVIPALCGLIPVIGPFIMAGYAFKVTKMLIAGEGDTPLPSLEFGADLGKGFMITLINLIYAIPVLILGGIASAIIGFGSGADEVVMWILIVLGGCFGLIGLLLGLLILFIAPIAVANYAAKGEFKAAFAFKEIFALLKSSLTSWLLVLVGGLLAGFIAPIGSIACGVGAMLTGLYAGMLNSHLIGQAYNVAKTPKQGELVL